MVSYNIKDISLQRKKLHGFEEYKLATSANSVVVTNANNDLVMISTSSFGTNSTSSISSSYALTASYALNGGSGGGSSVSSSWASQSLSASYAPSNSDVLKLNQTSPQTIINGIPTFQLGLKTTAGDILGGGVVEGQFGSTVPFYLMANWPSLGFNAYYDAGFRYGAGSANSYACFQAFNPTNGTMDYYISATAGNGAAIWNSSGTIALSFNRFRQVTLPGLTTDGYVTVSSGQLSSVATIASASHANVANTASYLNAVSGSVYDLQAGTIRPYGASTTLVLRADAQDDFVLVSVGGFAISDLNGGYIFTIDGNSGIVSGSVFVGYFQGTSSCAESLITSNNYLVNSLTASHGLIVGDGKITGSNSLINGTDLLVNANSAHAEGASTEAVAEAAHSEGLDTSARGFGSHAEGDSSVALGITSHAEGGSTAQGNDSHSEGIFTVSVGDGSHAEGLSTQAQGDHSHAEGDTTISIGYGSHTAGHGTIASASYQNVVGTYNAQSNTSSLFVVGNGVDNTNRSDIFAVEQSNVTVSGSLNVTSGSVFVRGNISASVITASLFFGTSSLSNLATAISFVPTNAVSASWVSASVRITTADTASFITASNISGRVATASYALTPWSPSGSGIVSTNQYAAQIFSSSVTVNWNSGNVQQITLLSGGNTFTFSNGIAGGRYLLIVRQPITGSGSITWPSTSSVLWAGGSTPTPTATVNKTDIFGFVYDGAIYYGSSTLNF